MKTYGNFSGREQSAVRIKFTVLKKNEVGVVGRWRQNVAKGIGHINDETKT